MQNGVTEADIRECGGNQFNGANHPVRRKRYAILEVTELSMLVPAVVKAHGSAIYAVLSARSADVGVTGTATYRDAHGQRNIAVELHEAGALRDQRLAVVVNGKVLGQVTVNSSGSATLERAASRGQAVPVIKQGSTIRVITAEGVVAASGRFEPKSTCSRWLAFRRRRDVRARMD